MKNSNETIGNRKRELTACSILLQPNTPPRVPDFLTVEYGTDRLSRKVGTELPIYAAQYPRKVQISEKDLNTSTTKVYYILYLGNRLLQ
jgi:hypothetical protein